MIKLTRTLCICIILFPAIHWLSDIGFSFRIYAQTGVAKSYEPENSEINALLTGLDSLLAKSDYFIREKEDRISRLRDNLRSATDPDRRYWLTAELYDEYSAYDSDSALHYADRALNLALRMGRDTLANEMRLNRIYILSATGLFDEAGNCLDSLNPHTLPDYLAAKYCERAIFLSTHIDQYIGVNRETEVYSLKVDSLVQSMRRHITPDHPQYGWLIGWSSLNVPDKAREAIPVLSDIVERTAYSTRGNAMDAWVLSKLYERVGDEQNHLKYLILSAMADVRACNKEIASLEELAGILFNRGDLDRANAYINRSIAYANEYKSRPRNGKLSQLQDMILNAIQKRNEDQIKVNHTYLWILIAILTILLFAISYIILQNKKLRCSRATLDNANRELNRRVDELSRIREELNHSNAKLQRMYKTESDNARKLAEINESKEAYIANIFTICSNYINKLEDFRANINKLLTARDFEKALRLVKSPELSYSEIKELCATFDEIFLKIYPDFVNDFNTLLKPEERITLKTPGKLNTELRIYALVRLGMNDSVKIAKFLHCSVQTVYNTRQRTRNKAIVERDGFAAAVMALGKNK